MLQGGTHLQSALKGLRQEVLSSAHIHSWGPASPGRWGLMDGDLWVTSPRPGWDVVQEQTLKHAAGAMWGRGVEYVQRLLGP